MASMTQEDTGETRRTGDILWQWKETSFNGMRGIQNDELQRYLKKM